MKYVMFEHAGSGNHGCEAIVRGTLKIIDIKIDELFSYKKCQEQAQRKL